MPRKSSFLMGFETGQDLYNKGFSQAQQAAQMKQRNQQLKLQQDSQAQRGKLLDMQLRGEEQRLAENTRQLNVAAVNRKTAAAALLEYKDEIASGRTVDERTLNWYSLRSKYEPLIFKDPEIKKGYETWKEAEIVDTQTYQTIQTEKENRNFKANAKLRFGQIQEESNSKVIIEAMRFFPGKTYTFDGDGAATAYSDLLRAEAVNALTAAGLPPGEVDINKDGRVTPDELAAAQGQVVKAGKAETKAEKDLDYERRKELAELGFKGRKELAQETSKLKRLESLNEQATLFGESGFEAAKINAALSGKTSLTELGKINKGLAASAGILRLKLEQIAQNPDTPGVDAIRVSSVFTNDLGTSEKAQLNKALSVKGQIERLGEGGYIEAVNTGRFQNKVAEVKAWFNTKGSRDLAVLEGLLNAVIPNLARGVYGEIGVLTDKDVDLYKGTFISPKNDEEVNRALFGLTEKLVHGAIKRQLKTSANGRINVSGYRDVWEELTGEQVSPHVQEMISPTGASGAPDMGQGAGRPSQPRLQQMVSIEPGQKFETEEQWRDALEIGAAAYPVGKKFSGLMVGDANAKAIAPDPAKVKEWSQQFVGRTRHDGSPAVHPSWIEKWEKEDEANAPTLEATTPKPTEPEEAPSARRMEPSVDVPPTTAPAPATDPDGEEVVDKITQDYINNQEYEDEAAPAPAPTETMEPPPVTTATGSTPQAPGEATEEANIVLNNIGISADGKIAGVLRKHFRIRQIKELTKPGTDEEKSERVEAFIKSLKGTAKAQFMADFNKLKKSKGER